MPKEPAGRELEAKRALVKRLHKQVGELEHVALNKIRPALAERLDNTKEGVFIEAMYKAGYAAQQIANERGLPVRFVINGIEKLQKPQS